MEKYWNVGADALESRFDFIKEEFDSRFDSNCLWKKNVVHVVIKYSCFKSMSVVVFMRVKIFKNGLNVQASATIIYKNEFVCLCSFYYVAHCHFLSILIREFLLVISVFNSLKGRFIIQR